MHESFVSLSLEDYSKALASPAFAPGGGSAAALCAALAAALLSMSRSLGCEDKAVRDSEELREALMELVDEDSAAFAPVADAWKLPADAPHRAEALEKAHAGAAALPLRLMRLCGRLIALCEEMRDKCGKNLLSDVAVSAALSRSVLCAAAVNVRANTFYMKEAASLNREADRLLEEYAPRADRVFSDIYAHLER